MSDWDWPLIIFGILAVQPFIWLGVGVLMYYVGGKRGFEE